MLLYGAYARAATLRPGDRVFGFDNLVSRVRSTNQVYEEEAVVVTFTYPGGVSIEWLPWEQPVRVWC